MNKDEARAVVADCARMRVKPAPKMKIEHALELAEHIERAPDCVISSHRLREAVRVLAWAVETGNVEGAPK